MALDGDVLGTKSILQSSKSAASDLVMKWNIPGTDVTQLLTVWTGQVKDFEQQNSNKTFGGFRSSWNPRAHDECGLMAAEIQTVSVCHVSGKRRQSAKDYWYQANKGE